jgi:ATP-dependent DNA helicase RecG
LDELLLLSTLLHQPTLSIKEAAHITQKSDTETHASLNSLKKMGLIERRGERQSQVWYSSSSTYRRLGEITTYTYPQGFESLKQERMILKYVQQHGRITRKEAVELCKLSPSQASRLLKKLAADGRLVRYGERKGTWYEPAAIL